MTELTTNLPILSVSQLNQHVRQWLEQEVGAVQVQGELSNLSKPASGHGYFTLKDAKAQLRCVYFRNYHGFGIPLSALQNGQQVVAHGQLSLYEARGDYQLIIDHLQEAGEGDLYRQFERLKAKLASLGLFDATRKKAIPRFANAIGVVTSPSAAALHDILTTLAKRFPLVQVVLYASDVQGKSAAKQLVQAIERANMERQCEVLILARGGGSLEDLFAFNDESLAYAIAASQIPIVTGIGHETDFTIADFVADLRAATPTAAAQAVTPDQVEISASLHILNARLCAAMTRLMQQRTMMIQRLLQQLSTPSRLIGKHWQALDYLERRLWQAYRQYMARLQHRMQLLCIQLMANHPKQRCQQIKTRMAQLEIDLVRVIQTIYQTKRQQLLTQLKTLHTVSPLATLERGYAIVTHHQQLVIAAEQVQPGDQLDIRLTKGELQCVIVDRHCEA